MHNPIYFILLSSLGTVFPILGGVISAFTYQGKRGERYSPLNHFISELGEVGVSRLAWVFNLGLILCGLCLIPANIILGSLLPGVLAKIGLVAGVITALGLSLVGVFPINNLKPHGKAAITFFRGGLLMVMAFSFAIVFQTQATLVLPRGFALAGLPAILAFGGFLLLIRNASTKNSVNPLQPMEGERPSIWVMPIVEWAIFLTIVLWFLLMSIGLSI